MVESFVSETFAKSLKITPKAAGRKRTYQSHSGVDLVATTRIKADIVFDKTPLNNKSLYVVEDKIGHKVVLGKELWADLQPQTAGGVLVAANDEQYTSTYSQLSQGVSSLAIADPTAAAAPSSYYPLPSQVAYSQTATYVSGTEQWTPDPQQIQPTLLQYSTFEAQPSYQPQSSYPQFSGYTSSAPQDPVTDSTHSNYTAQGNQATLTSNPPSTTFDEEPHVAPGDNVSTNENYRIQSHTNTYKASYQSPRQEAQEASWHTSSPSETVYDKPDQVYRPVDYYAAVPQYKYDQHIWKS